MSDLTPDRVSLRTAGLADCFPVWEWRNEKATRDASFNTGFIPYEEHEPWFARKLADPGTRIFIVHAEGRDIGYVRFEISGVEAEISVSIDKNERGKGYGVAAIRAGSDQLLVAERLQRIVAHVRQDNPVSLAAFKRAGFTVRASIHIASVAAFELFYEHRASRERGALSPSAWSDPRVGALTGPVLFRVDAGPRIGLGHLQRCLSLATALQGHGIACTFMAAADPAVTQRIEAVGFTVSPAMEESGTPADAAEVIAVAGRKACETIVVDSYGVTTAYLAGLRASGRFIAAIDDLASIPFPCHLVINGAAHAHSLRYRASLPDTVFLLGPRYALLRPEFWTSHPRSDGEDPPRVMLAVGGSDPFDVVPGLIETVAPLREEFAVDVIVGPFFHNLDHVERAANQAGRPVELHVAPTSVRPIMERATLAVSAAGQTLYELACVGCPTVAIQMADNQRPQLNALEAAGVLYSIGEAARPDTLTRLAEALPALLADRARRDAMSAAGRALVDGQGALRVAAAITSGFSRTMTGTGSSAREQ